MNTIKRQFEFYSISAIDEETAALIKEKVDSWYLVDDTNKNIHNSNHTGNQSFAVFNSALEIAKKREKILASSYTKWGDLTLSLIYLPKQEIWMLKVKDKRKLDLLVSDKYYAECLSNIKSQQATDRAYGWKPKEDNYYSTDNFTF